jgi:hypothetical protein
LKYVFFNFSFNGVFEKKINTILSTNNMIHLISFAYNSDLYLKKRFREKASMLMWFDTVTVYGYKKLSPTFRSDFKPLLYRVYHVWKFEILWEAMQRVKFGDVVIYVDINTFLNQRGEARFYDYIKRLQVNPILLFSERDMIEMEYSCRQLLEYFSRKKDESNQLSSKIIMLRKSPLALQMLQMGRNALYTHPSFFSADYLENMQCERFKRHNGVTSVMSVLCKRVGCDTLEDETTSNDLNVSYTYPFLRNYI